MGSEWISRIMGGCQSKICNSLKGIFSLDPWDKFRNNSQGKWAYIKCVILINLSIFLISYSKTRDLFAKTQFLFILESVMNLTDLRVGPNLEYTFHCFFGFVLGNIFSAIILLIAKNVIGMESVGAPIFTCGSSLVLVFIAMALHYSSPQARIFSISFTLLLIIMLGASYRDESIDIKLNGIYLAHTVMVFGCSLILFFIFSPQYSSRVMRSELNSCLENICKALEGVSSLISMSVYEPTPHKILSELKVTREFLENGKMNLLNMSKYMEESRSEIYRWYYSLWCYAEVKGLLQNISRHASGLLKSIELLYRGIISQSEENDEDIHKPRSPINITDYAVMYHVSSLINNMIESLEFSTILLSHPSSVIDHVSETFAKDGSDIENDILKNIETCDNEKEEILHYLISILIYNEGETSEVSMKHRKNSNMSRGRNLSRLNGDLYSRSDLCIFYLYFSLRQCARACMETLVSSRNLYYNHLHKGRHIFWPQIFVGLFNREMFKPKISKEKLRIWFRDIRGLPSNMMYFFRIAFFRGDVRYSLKCLLCVLICGIWIYIPQTQYYYQNYNMYWAVLTAVVTMGPTTGLTRKTVGNRMIGTLIGVSCALINGILIPREFIHLFGFFPLSVVVIYVLIFTKYAYLGRVTLLGYIAVILHSLTDKPDDRADTEPEITSSGTFRIALLRSLTVLLGNTVSIVISHLIFPTYSRVELRKTISRVIKSASFLLTERLYYHMREVNSFKKNKNQSKEGTSNDSNKKKGHNKQSIKKSADLGSREMHEIKHSIYGQDRRIRKNQINKSLLLIHKLINSAKLYLEFSKNEPNMDRPFDAKIYDKLIHRCTRIVNLLSTIEGALESQVFGELSPSELILVLWNNYYHSVASITATMNTLAFVLSATILKPLPACLPLGFARENMIKIKNHLLEMAYKESDSDSDDITNKGENPNGFVKGSTSKEAKIRPKSNVINKQSEIIKEDFKRYSCLDLRPLKNDTLRTSSANRHKSNPLYSKYQDQPYLSSEEVESMNAKRAKNLAVVTSSVAVRQVVDDTLDSIPNCCYDSVDSSHAKIDKEHILTAKSPKLSKQNYGSTTPIQKQKTHFDYNQNGAGLSPSTNFQRSVTQIGPPKISLVDIYIYAYYCAVECLIDEVGLLEDEVESLIGREINFSITPNFRREDFDPDLLCGL